MTIRIRAEDTNAEVRITAEKDEFDLVLYDMENHSAVISGSCSSLRMLADRIYDRVDTVERNA